MSLDKAIRHGKERRRPYRGAKLFDRTCRNHGTCEWCRDGRLHKFKKRQMRAENILMEFNLSRSRHKQSRRHDVLGDDYDDGQ